MRVLISAGHGDRDPGAVNVELRLREHVEAYGICWELRDQLVRAGHQVLFISCFQSLASKLREVNRLHAEQPIDLALEIHFNSATAPVANGTEVLYLSDKNLELAKRISRTIAERLETRDRGAQRRDNLGWLKRTTPPALIIETLFLSNASEAARCQTPEFALTVAKAITQAISA